MLSSSSHTNSCYFFSREPAFYQEQELGEENLLLCFDGNGGKSIYYMMAKCWWKSLAEPGLDVSALV